MGKRLAKAADALLEALADWEQTRALPLFPASVIDAMTTVERQLPGGEEVDVQRLRVAK